MKKSQARVEFVEFYTGLAFTHMVCPNLYLEIEFKGMDQEGSFIIAQWLCNRECDTIVIFANDSLVFEVGYCDLSECSRATREDNKWQY